MVAGGASLITVGTAVFTFPVGRTETDEYDDLEIMVKLAAKELEMVVLKLLDEAAAFEDETEVSDVVPDAVLETEKEVVDLVLAMLEFIGIVTKLDPILIIKVAVLATKLVNGETVGTAAPLVVVWLALEVKS